MIARFLTALSLLMFSGLASAHAGSAPLNGGLASGLLHPLLGLDHLVALLAIGIWMAFLQQAAQRSVLPVVLMGLLAGALASFSGLTVPGIEAAIVLSVIVVGLLLAFSHRLPAWGAASMAGGFMFFHGAAHGAEMQVGSDVVGYVCGLIVTSALMILIGRAAGISLHRVGHPVSRLVGMGVVLAGGLFATV